MSIFFGKLKKETTVRATISRMPFLSGTWAKAGTFFRAAVKPLNLLYRFTAATVAILVKRKSKAIAAPAQEIKADSVASVKVEAPATAHPATEAAVNQKVRLSVSARLQAYNRAAGVFMRKLFLLRKSKAVAAPGAVAKHEKPVIVKRTSKADAAQSTIFESRFNQALTGCNAEGTSAPGREIGVMEKIITATHEAKPVSAGAAVVNIDSFVKVSHKAKLSIYWIYPVLENGVLTIRQAFEPLQDGETLEIDHIEWALPTLVDGTLLIEQAHSAQKTNEILEVC